MSQQPVRAIFAIPGDLATPTGGYAYDRRVLALLSEYAIDARLLTLPGSFPRPGVDDLAITRQALSAVSPDDVLLIDGLAWGAMPVEIAGTLSGKIVALCHHPLGLESGLTQTQANALIANETMNLALAAKVVVTSKSTRDTLIAQFGIAPEKIVVAEPGTDPAPQAMGSGGESLNILAVGSIVPRKGYDLLVEALAGLRDFDWRLKVVGAQDRAHGCVQALRAQIAEAGLEERITLVGGASDDELDALYHQADLFVSSSRYEGYGMVLTEAMARGLPIIASTGGAAADTLPDGAGWKIAPDDAPALRQALRRALSDSVLRVQLAQAARAAALNLPSWNDAANIIAQTLRAVADGDSK